MIRPTVKIKGKKFVLVEPAELKRLERRAAQLDEALPPWPSANERGNYPAFEFADVSIARTIIEDRRALGLTQVELASLAGVRVETISRLESGKHSPTIRTVERIDKALKRAAAKTIRRSKR